MVEIEDDSRLCLFSAGVTYIPSLVSFGVCSGSEKCDYLGQQSNHWKNNREKQVETCSGPNKHCKQYMDTCTYKDMLMFLINMCQFYEDIPD